MVDYIILAVIALLAAIGIIYTVKHFRGEGGCCGGGGYKPKKKKLKNVLNKKSFKVGGMHCVNCKNRVEEAVNDIRGLSGKVDLKKGVLTVSYAEDVPDDVIIAKIEKNGYIIKQ